MNISVSIDGLFETRIRRILTMRMGNKFSEIRSVEVPGKYWVNITADFDAAVTPRIFEETKERVANILKKHGGAISSESPVSHFLLIKEINDLALHEVKGLPFVRVIPETTMRRVQIPVLD